MILTDEMWQVAVNTRQRASLEKERRTMQQRIEELELLCAQYTAAEELLLDVPGDTLAEKIAYLQAQADKKRGR